MTASQVGQTVQPEDLYELNFIQEAQLSPDGQMVAYALTAVRNDGETEEEYSAIWLLSLETGERRQLTTGTAKDSRPHWSPDGKQIAFVSTRDEKSQIYLVPVDGGAAGALTDLKQGVGGGPVWSPDGTHIAFTAGPAAEPINPTRPYRVTRHIYRSDGLGYLDNAVQDIYIIAAEGGEPIRLTDDNCQNVTPIWSPDGQEILYAAMFFPDSHRVRPALRVVNPQGEARDLVKDWGYALSAAWTPDGERVVFVGRPKGEPIGTQNKLWVVDRQGGDPECRTAALPYAVGGGLQSDMPPRALDMTPPALMYTRLFMTRDGEAAYAQVQEGGTIQLYRVALSGPQSCAPVVAGERACYLMDMSAEKLLFLVSTVNDPRNLFIADLEGEQERQLTEYNARLLTERDLPTVRRLLFPSGDGVPVEGWILKPAMGEAPFPTVLYIHGGPHAGFGHVYSFDFQMLAGAGYAVLFVNQRGSTGYGDAFATAIKGDWGNLDYEDLMAGVDCAVDAGIADPDRLGVCGLSGGGYLTCWIAGQTDRFKAAVPENPITNFFSLYGAGDIGVWFVAEELGGHPHEIPEVYLRCSPITYAHNCTTPTLLVQGESDLRCPAEQSEQFYAVLKANGCVVEMLRLPDSPHAGSIVGPPLLRRAQNEALLEWMNRFVLTIEPEDGETDAPHHHRL